VEESEGDVKETKQYILASACFWYRWQSFRFRTGIFL